MFVHGRTFQPNVMFEFKTRSLLHGVPLKYAPALRAIISLCRKGWLVTNTLSYLARPQIKAVKSFIKMTSGPNVINFLRPTFTKVRNKLESLSQASLSRLFKGCV